MALRYSVLASGSGGNCVWVASAHSQILIDCGLSARAIGARLSAIDQRLDEVSAVCCTHSHGDHVAGASVLARRHGLSIYGSAATLNRIRGQPPVERLQRVEPGEPATIGDLTLHSCRTLHDAPGSLAFAVTDGQSCLAVITDLGRWTPEVVGLIARADALVLESNHDPDMLRDGPYPARLKRRIRSGAGHLSNAQSAALLAEACHHRLQQVTLAHLSETNNAPVLARDTAMRALAATEYRPRIVLATQSEPTEPASTVVGSAAADAPVPGGPGQLPLLW